MKKFIVLLILLFPLVSFAADEVLVSPKGLISLEAAGIRSGFEVNGNADRKKVTYPYFWLDASGRRIAPYNGRADGKIFFICQDWDAFPNISNNECIGAGNPDECCTGENAGNCDDTFDNANCVAKGDPLDCCTGAGEGICSCWNDIRTLFVPVRNYLDGELNKWENISRQ